MFRILMIALVFSVLAVACASKQPQPVEEVEVDEVVVEEVVVEEPAPIAVVEPKPKRPAALPKTASQTPLLGLIGLAAVSGAAVLHMLRRRF